MATYIIGGVSALLALCIILWAIRASNNFKRFQMRVAEADSGIDVALTKRYDTLTKMIEVVKGFTKHETDLFTQVIKLRKGMSMAEKNEANKCMDELTGKLNVVAENYPELRSSRNYLELKKAIVDAEEHLQAARRLYNANVSVYNQSFIVFPASLVNAITGNKHLVKEFFEMDERKRADVEIKL
ncbi:MAG: LemA family protein [Oscillospiraceae bacterium]|nr:LemA family protein [Oscillospiraceae bacterium]